MSNKQKELIQRSILTTNSISFWGTNLINQYLKELKKKEKSIASSYSTDQLKEYVFDWIRDYDNDLSIFISFSQKAESQRNKTSQLYDIPNSIKSEFESYVKAFKPVAYDPYSSGSPKLPKIIYAKEDSKDIEIWFGVKSDEEKNLKLAIDQISNKAVKEEIINIVKTEKPDLDEVLNINIGYLNKSRSIYILKISKAATRLTIYTDQVKLIDPDDVDSKPVLPVDRLPIFLNTAIDSLQITKLPPEKRDLKRTINKSVLLKLSHYETKDYLFMPIRFTLELEQNELTEEVVDKFKKLSIDILKPAVSEYFGKKGTFDGFLANHQNFFAQNGILLKKLNSEPGIQQVGRMYLFFTHNSAMELGVSRIVFDVATSSVKHYPEKGVGIENDTESFLDSIIK